ncbi:UNVERIFIED_ORG: aldo/keto reductase [Bacillus sp. AZ43]
MTDDVVPNLGLGIATLMREPSRRKRRQLLDHAYEQGYRHFDVAPLYGLGAGEAELGEFVATHGDVVVATKVGLAPGPAARALAKVQGPLRAALQRFPALRSAVKGRSGAAQVPVQITEDTLVNSVENSLRRLRVESLDYLLLHEVPISSLSETAVAAAGRLIEKGSVRRFGISGPPAVVAAGDVDGTDIVTVVQTSDALEPATHVTRRDISWIHYGVLSTKLHRLGPVLQDPPRRQEIEGALGRGLRSVGDLASVLILLSATARPGATVLIGSTDPAHVTAAAHALRGPFPGDEALARVRRLMSDAVSSLDTR